MKKKILAISVIVIAAVIFSCGRVDCSDFTQPEDYYQLSMEDAAVLTGRYMHKHGMFWIRGTDGYDRAIGKLMDDPDFNKQIEAKALNYYIDAYRSANIDRTTEFTIHRIPKEIAGKTIQEYIDRLNDNM